MNHRTAGTVLLQMHTQEQPWEVGGSTTQSALCKLKVDHESKEKMAWVLQCAGVGGEWPYENL